MAVRAELRMLSSVNDVKIVNNKIVQIVNNFQNCPNLIMMIAIIIKMSIITLIITILIKDANCGRQLRCRSPGSFGCRLKQNLPLQL